MSSLFSQFLAPYQTPKQTLTKHRLACCLHGLLIAWDACLLCFRYVDSQRHTIQGDYIHTMEELAELVGVRPNLLALAFTDPKLALQILLGPCTPVQYRLQGPGKWAGARKTILTTEDRVRKPLRTRVVETDSSGASLGTVRVLMLAVAFFAVILAYF